VQKIFWLDSPAATERLPPPAAEARCDLAIAGGGFTGLWAALHAAPEYDRDNELTRLEMVRGRPIPFPPEPLRYGVTQLTRHALAKADERGGRRGPWLRALDRIGAGFDS
jgi:hypothetical protein